ncbi:MAG: GNAT family N-acetyltransferase [Faecousia sp.]
MEWGYGLDKDHRGQGYMTEAARVLLDWAFSQKDVYAVEAETLPDNAASQRVLAKLDFKPTGAQGEEGPRFRREKKMAQMSVVYMMLGMCCGMSLGVSAGNMTIGMVLGMAVGLALGAAIDSSEKKHRQQVLTGESEKNLT